MIQKACTTFERHFAHLAIEWSFFAVYVGLVIVHCGLA